MISLCMHVIGIHFNPVSTFDKFVETLLAASCSLLIKKPSYFGKNSYYAKMVHLYPNLGTKTQHLSLTICSEAFLKFAGF